MEAFAQFTPIERTVKEEALKYYADNNIDMPSNAYFTDFINKPTETKTPDKKVEHAKKPVIKTPKVLKSAPAATLPSKKEWPYKDNTVSNLVDMSTSNENKQNFMKELNTTDYSNEDKEYALKLAERESSFNPTVKNPYGYYGLFQFGKSALDWIGLHKRDLSTIPNQIHAVMKLTYMNDSILNNIKNQYEGKEFKGVKITKNGLRAAAHLLGASTVKDWFNGTRTTKIAKKGFKDANGTHITDYLKLFEY